MSGKDDSNSAAQSAPAPASPPLPQHPAGPWDIVLHVVARFPAIALTTGVVGVLFWGSGYIITQNTKAQDELARARSQIAEERSKHQDALIALTGEANARIAEREKAAQAAVDAAQQAKAAANLTVATAEAKALATVQDTLLTTSERIQALVAGQLSSMEELETVRTATAGELNRQLKALSDRRAELEKELKARQEEIDKKDLELDLTNVTVPLDIICRSIETGEQYGDPYHKLPEDAENLAKSIDAKNEIQKALLLEKLQDRGDVMVSAAVFYAIYQETGRQEWMSLAIAAMQPLRQISSDWLDRVGSQRQLTIENWTALAQIALEEIDQGITEPGREGTILGFLRWQMPVEVTRSPNRMESDVLWRVVVVSVRALQNGHTDRFGGLSFNALDVLEAVAPAAAHVWAYQLKQTGEGDELSRRTLSVILDRYSLVSELDEKPDPALVQFWTDVNLKDRAAEYSTLGTSDVYERL